MSDQELLKFLRTMSKFNANYKPKDFKYGNLYEFVLRNGSLHKATCGTPYLEMGKKKECFKNAFDLCEREDGYLRYVEGYAYSFGFPMLHAWAIDPGNYVYDPTWEDGKAYYGVTFPLHYVREIILKRKAWGVLDCWEIGYPLLTGEDEYPIKEDR